MRKGILFALVLLCDFASKYWVIHHLPLFQAYPGYPFGGIGVFQTPLLTLSIVHATNQGMAWGLFASFPALWPLLRIAITVCVVVYLLFFRPPKWVQLPLWLIVAGALGNILDYFLYGHVIDMIYFIFYRYSYPIFNLADSIIFLSVFYLMIMSYKHKHPGSHERRSRH